MPQCIVLWIVKKNFKYSSGSQFNFFICALGVWSGSAMVLGKLPVSGRPTIRIIGQGHTALAVGAGGVVWTCLLSSTFSVLFLPLSGRRPDID